MTNPIEVIKSKIDTLDFDFVRWRHWMAALSITLSVLTFVAIFAWPTGWPWGDQKKDVDGTLLYGAYWGIDFTGGTELQVKFKDESKVVDIGAVRDALVSMEIAEDAVQQIGSPEDQSYIIRIQDPTFGSEESVEAVTLRLRNTFGPEWIENSRVNAEVGVRMLVDYAGAKVDVGKVQNALADLPQVRVDEGREDNQVIVTLPGVSSVIEDRIVKAVGVGPDKYEQLSVESVGPKVGSELRVEGTIALLLALGLILIYIGFRFDMTYAPGAVLCLFHDALLTFGAFIVLGKEINLSFLGAILTIVGFSCSDTIVMYDRIRENRTRYRRSSLKELINRSLNETFTRTAATAFATTIAIAPFLFFGGQVIGDFSFAMIFGILIGTYSSVYVAVPMVLIFEDIKPHIMKVLAVPALQGAAAAVRGAAGAGGALAVGHADDDDAPAGPLTASEARRRERAKLERGSTDPK